MDSALCKLSLRVDAAAAAQKRVAAAQSPDGQEVENKLFCQRISPQQQQELTAIRSHGNGASPSHLQELRAKEDQVASLQSRLEQLEALSAAGEEPDEELYKQQLVREQAQSAQLREQLSLATEESQGLQSRLVALTASLLERDARLGEFSRAWVEEKRTGAALRQTQNKLLDDEVETLRSRLEAAESHPPPTTFSLVPPEGSEKKLDLSSPEELGQLASLCVPLFDQVCRRAVLALELIRAQGQPLGIRSRHRPAPVSLKGPSLVVTSVQEGGVSDGVLLPGDEVLEVNGHMCCGPLLEEALRCLKQASGRLRLVVARELKPGGGATSQEGTHRPSYSFPSLPGEAHTYQPTLLPPTYTSLPDLSNDLDNNPNDQCYSDDGDNACSPGRESVSSMRILREIQESPLDQLLEEEKEEEEEEKDEPEQDRDSLLQHYSLPLFPAGEGEGEGEDPFLTAVRLRADLEERDGRVRDLEASLQALECTIQRLTASDGHLHRKLKHSQGESWHLKDLLGIMEQKGAGLREEASALLDDRDKLRNWLTVVEEDMALAQSKVGDLREQLARRDDELFEMTEEFVEIDNRCDDLQAEREQLQGAKQQLEQHLFEQTEEFVELDNRCDDLQAEREQLQAAKQQLEQHLFEQTEEFVELDNRCDDLQAEREQLQGVKQQLEQQLAALSSRLEEQAAEREAERTTAREELAGARKELNRVTSHHDLQSSGLEERVAALAEREQQLSSVLAEQRQANAGLEQIVQQSEAETDQLRGDLDHSRARAQHLQGSLGQLEGYVDQLEEEGQRLRQSLEEEHRRADAAGQQLTEQDTQVMQLEEVVRLEEVVAELRAVKKRLRKNLQEQTNSNSQLQTEMETLTLERDRAEWYKVEASTVCEFLRDRVLSAEQSLVGVRGDLAGSVERERYTEEQLSTLRLAHRQLQDSSALQAGQLQVEKEALAVQLLEARRGVEELRGLSGKDSEKAAREVERLETVLDGLRQQLLLCDREKVSLSLGNDTLQAELRKVKEMAVSTQAERDALEGTIGLLKAAHSQLEQKAGEREAELSRAEQALVAARGQTDQLSAQIQTLTAAEESLSRESEAAKSCLLQHEEELMEAQLQLGQLSRRFDDTQSELERERKQGAECRAKLGVATAQCSQLGGVVERQGAELEQTEVSVRRLEAAVKSGEFLTSQESTRAAQHQAQARERAQELSALQSAWLEYQRESTARVEALAGERDVLEEARGRLEGARGQLEGAQVRLSAQVEELRGRCSSLEAESHAHQQASLASRTRADNLAIDLASAQEQVEGLGGKLQGAELEKERLATELNRAGQQYANLQEKTVAVETDRSNLERDLAESRKDLKAKRGKMIELASELSALQSSCDLNRQILESCEQDKSRAEAGRAEAERTASELQRTLKQAEQSNRSTGDELSARDAVIEQLRGSLSAAEAAIVSGEEQCKGLQGQLHSSQSERSQLLQRLQGLERTRLETQSTVDQLVAAQRALKEALVAGGDQKELEVARLREQVGSLEQGLARAGTEQAAAGAREGQLSTLLDKMEGERQDLVTALHKQKELGLKQRYEHVKATSALQEDFDAKERQLKEVLQQNKTLQQKAEQAGEELSNLQEQLSSLVSLKMLAAEKEALEDTLRKEAKSLKSRLASLEGEHGKAMALLRKHEVEASTRAVEAPPTPKPAKSASKDQLRAMLREREEEAVRLREYVQRLLEKVVERAPHLLELMHHR